MVINNQNNESLEKILINPAEKYDELRILSGYSSPNMVYSHYKLFADRKITRKKIDLTIGYNIPPYYEHLLYKDLEARKYKKHFSCCYIVSQNVHSKCYLWLKNSQPKLGFIGSANYSQNAFIDPTQKEVMTDCDPASLDAYIGVFRKYSINCLDPEAENHITKKKHKKLGVTGLADFTPGGYEFLPPTKENPYQGVRISFLDKYGKLPQSSGLNWAFRKDPKAAAKRESNQAYLKCPAGVYRSDFFPKRGTSFTVIIDEENHEYLIFTAQGDNAKQLTSSNNSLIGIHIRNKLGVDLGSRIPTKVITRYGKTYYEMFKIDNELYKFVF